jgi:nucleoid DNA-binding protein
MDSKFIKAFKELVREEIVKRNIIHIEGFGRFEVMHQKQYQKKGADGQTLMMPPKDTVVFTPDKRGDK